MYTYRKYISNRPRRNGCAKRMKTSLMTVIRPSIVYSRQNVAAMANINDGPLFRFNWFDHRLLLEKDRILN